MLACSAEAVRPVLRDGCCCACVARVQAGRAQFAARRARTENQTLPRPPRRKLCRTGQSSVFSCPSVRLRLLAGWITISPCCVLTVAFACPCCCLKLAASRSSGELSESHAGQCGGAAQQALPDFPRSHRRRCRRVGRLDLRALWLSACLSADAACLLGAAVGSCRATQEEGENQCEAKRARLCSCQRPVANL